MKKKHDVDVITKIFLVKVRHVIFLNLNNTKKQIA